MLVKKIENPYPSLSLPVLPFPSSFSSFQNQLELVWWLKAVAMVVEAGRHESRRPSFTRSFMGAESTVSRRSFMWRFGRRRDRRMVRSLVFLCLSPPSLLLSTPLLAVCIASCMASFLPGAPLLVVFRPRLFPLPVFAPR